MPRKVEDLTGRSFNKWRVLSFAYQHPVSRNVFWNVVCDCGEFAVVAGTRLVRGGSKQCKKCAAKHNGRIGLYAKATGDLYLIRVGDFVKIGVSSNVRRRIKDIESTCPFDAELIYHGVNEGCDEAFWHSVFAHRHHRGEWFCMPT